MKSVYFSLFFFLSQLSFAQNVELVVLGNIQDAGHPHINCEKICCTETPSNKHLVSSLGLIDHENNFTAVFDASPDFSEQLRILKEISIKESHLPDAIFLTHAHIGHYIGLMYLGREACNAEQVPVYCLPRMHEFLNNNGPWNQLVELKNIKPSKIAFEKELNISDNLSIMAIEVPHRDEYSETAAYVISGPQKTALFIPDIDKWSKWKVEITDLIKKVDFAFLDATFYDNKEINNRNMDEIPHPFVLETMAQFKSLNPSDKDKVYFIHLNHTNPMIDENSKESLIVIENGYHIARQGMKFKL